MRQAWTPPNGDLRPTLLPRYVPTSRTARRASRLLVRVFHPRGCLRGCLHDDPSFDYRIETLRPPGGFVCIRVGEVRRGEVCPDEVRPDEVRPGEVRPGEVRIWFDCVAVDFHGSHVTSRSAGQPEGASGSLGYMGAPPGTRYQTQPDLLAPSAGPGPVIVDRAP